MIESLPCKNSRASGRNRPWVSEMTATRITSESTAYTDPDPQPRFLLVLRLVGGNDLFHECVVFRVIRMDQVQNAGGLAGHLAVGTTPLTSRIHDRQALRETRRHRGLQEAGPLFTRNI